MMNLQTKIRRFAPLLLICWIAAPVFAQEPAPAQEQLPKNATITQLKVTPEKIDLTNRFAYSQLLVMAKTADGNTIDVTRIAKFTTPKNAKVSDKGLVTPVADGKGEIVVEIRDQRITVPINVTGQKKDYKVSFVKDVMPVMSKLGCNAGTCHGAAKGQNGFQLSLRGYDPLFDHRSLTDDVEGRRFDRAAPERSLMLQKATGGVPHVGGVLFQPGDAYYDIFHSWIADGVKLDLQTPRVSEIQVYPQDPVIALPGIKQQMAVYATYSDGSVRDVSKEAFVAVSNTEIGKIDNLGLITALRRGETAVLARYEGAYAATPLIIMGDRSGFAWQDVPTNNFIDELVYDKLKAVKVLPSELCTDETFIRRAYLDITGLPPSPDDVRKFLADNRPTNAKRDALIDRLVGSQEYIDYWTNKWSDLLQVNRKFLGEMGAQKFNDWIKKAVATNMPYDKFALELLTGSGSTAEHPEASYYKILREPGPTMENTTHLFLGVRFNCNKCHDHPFEKWTQDQYYHLAAFFAKVQRRPDPKYKGKKVPGTAVQAALPLVEIISDGKSGQVTHDRTGQVVQPKFPFVHEGKIPDNVSPREQLAHWVTSQENPYFAKSFVNRIWSYMLGVGIIEPVDDIRAGNTPTNPELLDRLTREFIDSGFDVRHLIRTICKSRTYQLSVNTNRWNKDDEQNYSHTYPRRLPAEVLYDAIHRATGSTAKLPGLPPGSRAVHLLDSNVKIPGGFLDLFGRPPRESACECERANTMMLGPVMNLVNGPVVADALQDPNNRLAKLIATEKNDTKVVEEIFLSFLNRYPNEQQLQLGLQRLLGSGEEYEKLVAERAKRQKRLDDFEKTLPALQAKWEEEQRSNVTVWHELEPDELKGVKGSTLTKQPDNSVLVSGKNPSPETYIVSAETKLKGITGIRLEVMTDKSLPKNGPGRAENGNFVLNDLKLSYAKSTEPKKVEQMKLTNAQADFSQNGFDIGRAVDNNQNTGWAISPQLGKPHVAVFQTQKKIGTEEGTILTFRMLQKYQGKDHNIGRFRLSVTTSKTPIRLKRFPDNIARILDIPAEKRTDKQKTAIANYYRSQNSQLAELQQSVNEINVPASARLMGAQDLAWALINTPAFLFNH